METEIVDQQHDQNDVVEFELTEESARAANTTVNYMTIGHVQNMNTATKLEQIGSNSLHIRGNLANSKSTSYTTNYINIENVHQHPAKTSDEATNSATENQNPKAAKITTVDEAEENYAPNINIEKFQHFTITSEQDEPTSSATQNQSFMGRIANQIGDKNTTILKQMLQQFYKEVTLPCVTWLDKGQDLIMSNYYTKLQLNSSKTTITIGQIFNKIDEKEPKRILIEGQPGYGKTTLATKLIYDWAVQEKYIKDFKLAFLLPLRELQKQSIEQAMTDIANMCGFNNNSCLRNIIQDNISNILLIVDGLDELAVTDRMPSLKLLYKQEYAQVTVIVTCRTGSFTPDRDELSKLFGGISKKKVFYDKRAEVLGIAIKNRQKFLLNFIPNENAEDIITQIENLTDPVKEMFKSPLFLILLAFIASNESDLTALSTKTDLFKRLFNCIINRSLKTQECNEYNLFNFDSTLNETQNTIQQYGKRALDQLVNNKMQFECNELTKQIYQLGFLIKNKQISGFHSHIHYKAFHRSILEFAAAFSLWINFKQSPSSTNAFHHIQSIYLQLDQTSLVVPFLIGLLQHEACYFFNKFTCYAHLFSSSKEIFWSLLTECPTNTIWNKLLPSIIPFIPTIIDQRTQPLTRMQLPNFFDNLIQVGIENNQIKIIIVSDAYFISRLPKNVIIPNLIFSDSSFHVYDQKQINSFQGIQCKNFHLSLNEYDDLNLFSLILAQSYSLNLRDFGRLSEFMYKHIDDDVIKQLQLNHLYLVKYNPILKYLIPILLKRNQVQHLHMSRCDNLLQLTDYYEIISAASISSCLHSLELEWGHSDEELIIDLFDLTQGGKKKYNHLSFKNCQIVSKYEIQDKNCIHSLIINYDEEFKLRQSSDGLSAIAPEILRCNLSVIQQLSQLWMGYISLKKLELLLDDNIEDWSFLSNCKNIKKLTISFVNHYKYSLDIMNEFIKCVQQLPIEQLGIVSDRPHSVWEKLCKHIASSLPWKKKSHPIQTLKLSFFRMKIGEDETICSVILDFLECLKLGYLKTINLSYNQHLNWHSLMRSNIIDYSLFRITHSFEDDEYSNFRRKFCINLKE